jgi:hypothetical protein
LQGKWGRPLSGLDAHVSHEGFDQFIVSFTQPLRDTILGKISFRKLPGF